MQVEMDVVNWEDVLEDLGCWEERHNLSGPFWLRSALLGAFQTVAGTWGPYLTSALLVSSETISLTSSSCSLFICKKKKGHV